MQSRWPRIIMTVFLAALLAGAVVMSRLTAQRGTTNAADASQAMARYGFRFEEVSQPAGGGGGAGNLSRISSPAFIITYRSSTRDNSFRTSPKRV